MAKRKANKVKAVKVSSRKLKLKEENKIISELEAKVLDFDDSTLPEEPKFTDFPLSEPTLAGLQASHYSETTDIQRQSLIPALQGHDILGAARTGSGKTLAFLIPVLENLYRKKWNQLDGLGALIISPTRELAIQIFQVLRKIGREHNLSAGLVIGGKDVQTESERLSRLNIIIGTPGRILQHLDQTAGFDTANLQMLVLDEADRILDMGFKKSLDAIVESLNQERQTLLFSATQTKSVNDLARLSLSEPKYISVHEESTISTPKGLEQFYISIPLEQKLDTLWGFIKSHLKSKILVFFSSSKEVRFVYETFRRMQPGIPLLHLHGKQKQQARIDITQKFSSSQNSCLFATDIVARGIDFPFIDWVIQFDAPEDAATYIHRVGRSARFDKTGRALLFLTSKEEPGMVERLKSRKVPINKLVIKESKKKQVQQDLQALCFKEPEIKYLGQKAFVSYVRSIFLQKDKEIFNVEDLPLEEYAKSLGLPGAPKIKVNRSATDRSKELKNAPRALTKKDSDDEEGDEDKKKPRTKYDRMFERQNQNVLSEHYRNLTGNKNANEDEDGDFLSIKRSDHVIEDSEIPDLSEPTSKRQAKKALSKKASSKSKGNSTKLVFDDDGNAHPIYELEDEDNFHAQGSAEQQKEEFISREADLMKDLDKEDKEFAREKRLEKKRSRKEKERQTHSDDDDDEEVQVVLGGADSDDGESESDDEPTAKKPKWFQKDDKQEEDNGVLEVEEPETLEDLEALSRKLLGH